MFANLLAKIGTLGRLVSTLGGTEPGKRASILTVAPVLSSHDLVFVLTGGGKINFQGANVWLKSLGVLRAGEGDWSKVARLLTRLFFRCRAAGAD